MSERQTTGEVAERREEALARHIKQLAQALQKQAWLRFKNVDVTAAGVRDAVDMKSQVHSPFSCSRRLIHKSTYKAVGTNQQVEQATCRREGGEL